MDTPIRKLRMEDQLWNAAERLGESIERSASWVIRTALEEYLDRQRAVKRATKGGAAPVGLYTVTLEPKATVLLEAISRATKKSADELIGKAVDQYLDTQAKHSK